MLEATVQYDASFTVRHQKKFHSSSYSHPINIRWHTSLPSFFSSATQFQLSNVDIFVLFVGFPLFLYGRKICMRKSRNFNLQKTYNSIGLKWFWGINELGKKIAKLSLDHRQLQAKWERTLKLRKPQFLSIRKYKINPFGIHLLNHNRQQAFVRW